MTSFRWNPADYAANSSAQFAWAQRLLARLDLRGDEAVLDVGCGDGRITAEVARVLPRGRAVGADSSPEMIAHARVTHPRDQFPQLEFVEADARRLNFLGEFDVVFSNAALHWVPDHPAVLRSLAQALKPVGRLTLSFGGRGNAGDLLPVFDEVTAEAPWAGYFHDFVFPYHFPGIAEYERWLPAAGLQATRLELVPQDMTHESPDGLAGWLRTTWLPYTQRLPADQRERFVQGILGRYLNQCPPDAAGRTHVRMVRLEVEAGLA
jgi:trans-aconitate 2-methyltransferase